MLMNKYGFFLNKFQVLQTNTVNSDSSALVTEWNLVHLKNSFSLQSCGKSESSQISVSSTASKVFMI